jgi:hypothetical protein
LILIGRAWPVPYKLKKCQAAGVTWRRLPGTTASPHSSTPPADYLTCLKSQIPNVVMATDLACLPVAAVQNIWLRECNIELHAPK